MKVSSHGGHSKIVPGANWGNRKEHEMDRELNSMFIDKLRSLGHDVKNDCDETGSTASSVVNNQVRNINSRNNDVAFSWHLNASNGQGNGVEVLCYSQKEVPMAAKISAEIAKRTGWKDRGAKIRPDIGVIRSTNCTAFLIEAGFIDNDGDMAKWNPQAITDAVIYAYFGQTPKGSSSQWNIEVETGGFSGQGLTDMHNFLVSNGWWNFELVRQDDLSIMFKLHGIDEYGYGKLKEFMNSKGYWFTKK